MEGKFKEGNKIICTQSSENNYYKKGAIGKIVLMSDEEDGWYKVEFETLDLIKCNTTSQWWVREEHMELYIKMGDRVRVKTLDQLEREYGKDFRQKRPGFIEELDEFCGKEYTVTNTEPTYSIGTIYKLSGCEYWSWGDWMFEKVKKGTSEDTITHGFKYGDRIICTKTDKGNCYEKGAIGKIIPSLFGTEYNNMVYVKFETLDLIDNSMDSWFVAVKDMELLKEETEIKTEEKETQYGFKVGDRITCVEDCLFGLGDKVGEIVGMEELGAWVLFEEDTRGKFYVSYSNMRLHIEKYIESIEETEVKRETPKTKETKIVIEHFDGGNYSIRYEVNGTPKHMIIKHETNLKGYTETEAMQFMMDEMIDEIEENSQPYLTNALGEKCGVIGTETGLLDENRKPLYVGDIVRVSVGVRGFLAYVIQDGGEFAVDGLCGGIYVTTESERLGAEIIWTKVIDHSLVCDKEQVGEVVAHRK